MRVRVGIAALAFVVVALATPVAATTAARLSAPRQLPRVTLISDSVAGSISFDIPAEATLARGIDLFLDPGEGRTLGGTPPDGSITPSALQLIETLGTQLGPTVIMDVGYNDVWTDYAHEIALALEELESAGVQHMLWVTLRVSPAHASYAVFNSELKSAAAAYPQVTIVDWNAYSKAHPQWFQADGVHLQGAGPQALANLLHATLVKLKIPARTS